MKFDLKRVFIAGKGKPLLIYMEWGGLAPVLDLAKDLSDKYWVIAPIMPGFLPEDGIIHYNDALYLHFVENISDTLRIDQ